MNYEDRPKRLLCQWTYFRTVPGILKLIEIVCSAVALILGAVASSMILYAVQKSFFVFVSAFSLIVTVILYLLSMINFQAICIPERWPFIELVLCGLCAILFVIASSVVATIAATNGVYGAAAFFGFAACITFAIDASNRARLGAWRFRVKKTTTETTTTVTTTITNPT